MELFRITYEDTKGVSLMPMMLYPVSCKTETDTETVSLIFYFDQNRNLMKQLQYLKGEIRNVYHILKDQTAPIEDIEEMVLQFCKNLGIPRWKVFIKDHKLYIQADSSTDTYVPVYIPMDWVDCQLPRPVEVGACNCPVV